MMENSLFVDFVFVYGRERRAALAEGGSYIREREERAMLAEGAPT